jgi:SH3-like domain-containing protein
MPTKAPAARVHRPAAPSIRPTDVIVRSANVRSGPSKTESLVTTLASDVPVMTVERSGSWAHIQFLAADGKPHDGWVFNTFLKAAPVPAIRATSVP